MSARELEMTRTRKQLHTAATERERVRVRGRVAECGDGYSGTYRNVWLRVAAAGASTRVTASPSSRLGTLPVGSWVEIAARLTGMVELGWIRRGTSTTASGRSCWRRTPTSRGRRMRQRG